MYIKLYQDTFIKVMVFVGLTLIVSVYFCVGGIQRDVFSGQKKIVLVNEHFENKMDKYLIFIMLNQLCDSLRVN